MFDLGMAMIAMSLMREEPMRLLNHMEKSTSIRFWHAFLKGYFGKDCRIADMEEEFQQIVLEAFEKGYFKA